MNYKTILSIMFLILITTVSFNIYLLNKLESLEKQLITIKEEPKEKEDFELAPLMANFQRYSEKLYFAAKNKNWELTKFYLHEMDETAEKIMKSNIIEEDVNVSVQIKEMLVPKIKELEEKVSQKNIDEFEKSYKAMLMNCNGCHMITKHGFIKIREPKQNIYSQDF